MKRSALLLMIACVQMRFAIPAMLGLLSIAGLPALRAQAVLDQQQTSNDGGLGARTLKGYTVWQSFTAGISGTLSSIHVGFFGAMSGDGQLMVYAGEGIGGRILQSAAVTVVSQSSTTWNVWNVNVPVVSGNQYTFQFVPNPATLPDPYGVAIGSGYIGGYLGTTDPSGSSPTQFDWVFQTYVTPASGGSPIILGLGPSSATAGGSAFTLTVNGTGFASGAVVQWNGSPLTTAFVNAMQVTATVGASLIAKPGSASVWVTSSGLASAQVIFTVNASANAPQSNISGSWQIATASSVFTEVVNGLSGNSLLEGVVTQNGFNVSAGLTNNVGWAATLAGVVSQTNQITGTLAYQYYYGPCQEIVTLTGTVSADGNSASGTYAAPMSACAQADYGTWGGTRPSFAGLTNAASFAKNANGAGSGVAPGSLITIFGTVNPVLACFCFSLANFGIVATDDFGVGAAEANSIPFPTNLGGVNVTINGVQAPLVAMSSGQVGVNPFINAQVPYDAIQPGAGSLTTSLVVTTTTPVYGSNGFYLPGGFAFPPVSIQIVPAAPGIFTTTENGLGQAILVYLANLQIAAPSSPIPRGGTAFFYATGLGALQPPVADGAASPASPAVATPTVLVGGIMAPVLFAGQAPGFPGVNQINITIPANAPTGNTVPLQIQTADGSLTTSNLVTIAVK